MTKYIWEKELRNNLKNIPQEEVSNILAYYDELFADKAEQGLSEKQIIREFGNPYDVAYKIVYCIEGQNVHNKTQQHQITQSNEALKKQHRNLLAKVIFFVPFCIISIVLWSLVIGLSAGGIGAAVGGLGMIFVGFYQMATSTMGGLATVGMALAAAGAGLIISVIAFFIIKATVRLTQKYFFMGKHRTNRRNN